jgi:NitT/TauT family transport system substrate-binding protein
MSNTTNRRRFLGGMAAGMAAASFGFPAIAQERTKIKVGYLHTSAVDAQIWTGEHIGSFA